VTDGCAICNALEFATLLKPSTMIVRSAYFGRYVDSLFILVHASHLTRNYRNVQHEQMDNLERRSKACLPHAHQYKRKRPRKGQKCPHSAGQL
jgi:hypothetical protein